MSKQSESGSESGGLVEMLAAAIERDAKTPGLKQVILVESESGVIDKVAVRLAPDEAARLAEEWLLGHAVGRYTQADDTVLLLRLSRVLAVV